MADKKEDFGYNEEYIKNSRGTKLFTCKWFPLDKDPKALIFICHGYAMECSITMKSTAVRLVDAGYAVYGIDYEGHGKSSGLHAYVRCFDALVDDCAKHFTSISETPENKGKKKFLLGESMGGAVAILLGWKLPDFWDGTVLVAPMCKISDDVKPSPIVLAVISSLASVVPTWKGPSNDIIDVSFKEPRVRKEVRENRYCYHGRPRIKTGYQLLLASEDIERRLAEVTVSFIVLHGEDDKVIEPAVSKQLHEVAASKDKTIKLYPGMWHGLLYGEPEENINIVFNDIIEWLEQRTSGGGSVDAKT